MQPCAGFSRNRRLALVMLIGLAGGFAGCTSPADPVAASRAPRVVDTVTVEPASSRARVALSGRVRAAQQTRLSFEIAGEIQHLVVDVGDSFDTGDTLATVADERYRLIHDRALASEREALSVLNEARLDYRRQQDLGQQGYVSQARLDSARAALDTAGSRHESAVASRRLAQRDLNQSVLKAPFTGTVSQRLVEPSERVNANQPVLEVISQQQGFEITTSVPETLIGRLIPQSLHKVTVAALDERRLPVSVRHIGTQPRSSNNYPLILKFERTLPGLRSGMTAQVYLDLDSGNGMAGNDGEGSVRVPLTALVYNTDGAAHVLRVDPENRLQRVNVRIVTADDQGAAVVGDLAEGTRIVARGAEFVTAGETVKALGQGPERFH